MIAWASIVALLSALVALWAGDPTTILTGIAELTAVTALFTLVCAAEAFN